MNKKLIIGGIVGVALIYLVMRKRKQEKDLADPEKQDVLEEADGPMWYEDGMVQKIFVFLNEEMKKRGFGAVEIRAQTYTSNGSDIQEISADAFRDANKIMAEKLLEAKAYVNNAEMKNAYRLWLMRNARMDKPREYRLQDLGAAPMPKYTDMVFNRPKAQPASYRIKEGI